MIEDSKKRREKEEIRSALQAVDHGAYVHQKRIFVRSMKWCGFVKRTGIVRMAGLAGIIE
jgi:hypothetical protein